MVVKRDRKSTRLNSSHTVIYTLSLHDALPISLHRHLRGVAVAEAGLQHAAVAAGPFPVAVRDGGEERSEEHTSELQSHRDLHSFPTRRSSDLSSPPSPRRRRSGSRPSARGSSRRAVPGSGPRWW